jgi:ubiquinone/menaquinone biosynthesis C-methylase UbiE
MTISAVKKTQAGARLIDVYDHLLIRTLSVYWQARAPHVLPWLALDPTDVVLEVGCGYGIWTSYIAPRVQAYWALDLNPKAIQGARRWRVFNPTNANAPNVHFSGSNAEKLPFQSGSFSKVFLIDVIEHIPDHQVAVQEIARVLKPGGRVVMTTMLENRPSYIRRIEFPDHVREYTPESLLGLFDQTDLVVDQVEYFYYAPTMIARELQWIGQQWKVNTIPGVNLAAGLVYRLISNLEHYCAVGMPGGICVLAVKKI